MGEDGGMLCSGSKKGGCGWETVFLALLLVLLAGRGGPRDETKIEDSTHHVIEVHEIMCVHRSEYKLDGDIAGVGVLAGVEVRWAARMYT